MTDPEAERFCDELATLFGRYAEAHDPRSLAALLLGSAARACLHYLEPGGARDCLKLAMEILESAQRCLQDPDVN